MDRPDFERIRKLFLETGDTEVVVLVRVLDTVFRAAKYRPRDEALAQERDLVAAVRLIFPTPFAEKFASWVDAEAEFRDTLARSGNESLSTEERRRAQLAIPRAFRNAFLELWACWRQIVHFLPFVLIVALRRLNDDELERYAAKELKHALYHYKAFYGTYDDSRKKEADQRHLLIYLLRLFRLLSRAGVLNDEFVFAPLLAGLAHGFGDLFPERFDAGMLLIQQVRNRIIHGMVENRLPDITEAVHELTKWCFLDIISILAPICRGFGVNYVTRIDVGASEAEALDFSGIDGPREARYRIASEPQTDDYSFSDLRLYLIARARQMGAGSGEKLEPRDYLELMPFLITDRLRTSAARREKPLEERERMLFALEQYIQPLQRLLFLELAGRDQKTLPASSDDRQTAPLLKKIDGFETRARLLTAKVTIRTVRTATAEVVRSQLWPVSKDNLGSVMDAARYNERGELLADVPKPATKTAYDPDLFVEPREGASLAEFLRSDRRGLLLVGDSGFGKSNLLVHHFLERLRAGGLAVFLAGRQLDSPSFRQNLLSKVVSQLSNEWKLDDLDEFLDENGETLVIFVDAINEYSGSGGPLALLTDLIAAVKGEQALRRCKVVATCRTEIWAYYRESHGGERPLDPSVFFAPNGDAAAVGGFDDKTLREKLFEAYQRKFGLQPVSYEALSEPVRALIAQPLMMALVAETYSNRTDPNSGDARQRRIPRDLDYFSLFSALTERKRRDAEILAPSSDVVRRKQLPNDIEDFCELAGELIYDRLTSADPKLTAASNPGALPIDVVDKEPRMQRYVRGGEQLSVLETALQIGLIDQVTIPQRNKFGKTVPGDALAFFHDQYTQFWLAVVYQQHVLGPLEQATLDNGAALDVLAMNIGRIVTQAVNAPVLGGALDHWIHMNLENFHGGRIDAMLPLFDRLAVHESAAVRYYVVAILTNLILRGILEPEDVYSPIFRNGCPRLRSEMVSSFVEFWPELPPAAARAFIDACDPSRDQEPLERLGDTFTLHLLLEPQQVVDYLNNVVNPLTLASVAEPQRMWRQFRFALQFAIFAMIACFDQPASLEAVRSFFRTKYQPVIDLLTSSRRGFSVGQVAKRSLRQLLFWIFESFGAAQWNQFIGSMRESGNDRFFEENGGVVQHDVLLEFLPYAVDIQNGEFGRLSLEAGSAFRELMLRMIDFRVMSIIGYNATLCLPSVLLRNDWKTIEALIMEIIERRTPSSLFYGNLLLANLSYSDRALAQPCLELMRDRIVPLLLREGLASDWSITFCIATLDVERLWPAFEAILRQLLDHYERTGDAAACSEFGDTLFKICYCHDIALGTRVIEMLVRERSHFLGPLWRECTLKVFGAMLARSPATLRTIFTANGIDESMTRQARGYQSAEIVKQSRLFPMQVDVNRFTAWLYVAEPRLRYPVVKYFIGSLAAGSTVADFATGVRQTLIAFINVFFGEHPNDAPQGRLSVDEIVAAVKPRRAAHRISGRIAPGLRRAGG